MGFCPLGISIFVRVRKIRSNNSYFYAARQSKGTSYFRLRRYQMHHTFSKVNSLVLDFDIEFSAGAMRKG